MVQLLWMTTDSWKFPRWLCEWGASVEADEISVGCGFVLVDRKALAQSETVRKAAALPCNTRTKVHWSTSNLDGRRSVNGSPLRVVMNGHNAIIANTGPVESIGVGFALNTARRQECTRWIHLEDGPDAKPTAYMLVRAAMFGRHLWSVGESIFVAGQSHLKLPLVNSELSHDLYQWGVPGQAPMMLTADGHGEVPASGCLYMFFVAVMRRWVQRCSDCCDL